jgi:hypothetical protein
MTLGSWPDWIAAIFTSLAFVVAAFSYARNVKIRRESQARLVYSKLTHLVTHEPGATFDLLPNGATVGNGLEGAVIVTDPKTGRGQGLAIAPLLQVTAIIHNGSKELIGPARIQMVNAGRKMIYEAFAARPGAIDPESECIVNFYVRERRPSWPAVPRYDAGLPRRERLMVATAPFRTDRSCPPRSRER